MSRESTTSRCEQSANHMLVYGRPPNIPEIVTKVEAVDEAAIRRVVARLIAEPPTLTAVGPTAALESYDEVRARLS